MEEKVRDFEVTMKKYNVSEIEEKEQSRKNI